MVQKLITTVLIFIFLLLAIVGLNVLFGGSDGGTQEISHHMVFLLSTKNLAPCMIGAGII